MGKRSNFTRLNHDSYMTTDRRAIRPLVQYYYERTLVRIPTFYEPCVGDGDLVKLLAEDGFKCVGTSDTNLDARSCVYMTDAECFITNPPWTREILHPIIENLRKQLPTWLLFDADWMFTAQSSPYMEYCKLVLPIGRLNWIPGTKDVGKDNCAWYLFVNRKVTCTFVPKLAKLPKSLV